MFELANIIKRDGYAELEFSVAILQCDVACIYNA